MVISMIAAMASNRVIGKENQMPWHLPADFAWFKRCTLGKPIIMGRKTFESIGRALPGRQNIVITRNHDFHAEGVDLADSFESALTLAAQAEEVMVIGGGSIYHTCLPMASRLYLTYIQAEIDGDTQFPEIGPDWNETYREEYVQDSKNAYDMSFVILEKNNG
ncbi:type 3 dihydrofolate reductase [Vibrio mangrovi]|uniref:Dihydrofolate reductase n=1 Tax=Vibrio mangrovi TaxID=474394 RepID=A0A1Y6IXU6_9VIBR|nr:type 3 dihydrofolate reductase [Vibrio mangrovi]MDW6001995.1 type 3 dihydrofolate reductase [Vibrio mangrovi]SMS02458.1 Dihydrofolate reductase type 3 [Vibrio mangrovi]